MQARRRERFWATMCDVFYRFAGVQAVDLYGPSPGILRYELRVAAAHEVSAAAATAICLEIPYQVWCYAGLVITYVSSFTFRSIVSTSRTIYIAHSFADATVPYIWVGTWQTNYRPYGGWCYKGTKLEYPRINLPRVAVPNYQKIFNYDSYTWQYVNGKSLSDTVASSWTFKDNIIRCRIFRFVGGQAVWTHGHQTYEYKPLGAFEYAYGKRWLLEDAGGHSVATLGLDKGIGTTTLECKYSDNRDGSILLGSVQQYGCKGIPNTAGFSYDSGHACTLEGWKNNAIVNRDNFSVYDNQLCE